MVSTAKGRFLTVPLPAALNADGTPKKPSARDWGKTIVIAGKRGQWIICLKKGRGLIPLYVLKQSISYRPRLGLRKVMVKELSSSGREIVRRIKELMRDL